MLQQIESLDYAQRQREKLKAREEKAKRLQRASFQEYCENDELFPDEPPAKHHAFMIGALPLVFRLYPIQQVR